MHALALALVRILPQDANAATFLLSAVLDPNLSDLEGETCTGAHVHASTHNPARRGANRLPQRFYPALSSRLVLSVKR